MNAALEAIMNKGRAERSPLEQCIADSVSVEDMRDGEYKLQELAASQLAELTGMKQTLHDHVLVVMKASTILDQTEYYLETIKKLHPEHADDADQLLKQIADYFGPYRLEDPNDEQEH